MFGIFEIFIGLFTLAISTALFILWGWAIIDILKSDFKGVDKIIWLLVVFFLNILGAILYYFIGTKQKLGKNTEQV
ncbi:MAG: PLD nuclease N-terminal domain-containing protein [Deferribacterales bacterium]